MELLENRSTAVFCVTVKVHHNAVENTPALLNATGPRGGVHCYLLVTVLANDITSLIFTNNFSVLIKVILLYVCGVSS